MVLRLLTVELRYCKVSCAVALDQLKVALDLGEGYFISDIYMSDNIYIYIYKYSQKIIQT